MKYPKGKCGAGAAFTGRRVWKRTTGLLLAQI